MKIVLNDEVVSISEEGVLMSKYFLARSMEQEVKFHHVSSVPTQ